MSQGDGGHRPAGDDPSAHSQRGPTTEGAARLRHFAASLSDSAGQAWEGRHFGAAPFGDDDGTASSALLGALAAFRAGEVGAEAVVDLLRGSRLLIPLIAELGESGSTEAGLIVDKSQELSIVTVAGPDGRSVLPVFSSVIAMQTWNPEARPVPVDGRRVALAAVAEETELVVLDPASETEFVLRRPAVWAVARGESWLPSYRDAEVYAAFEASIAAERGVRDVRLDAGDPEHRMRGEELVVRLALASGLTGDELEAIVARLAQRWAADGVIAARVDSLRVQLVAHG